ncbi:hypothetical protein TWF281_006663 [Arthrobotrys megalospora]
MGRRVTFEDIGPAATGTRIDDSFTPAAVYALGGVVAFAAIVNAALSLLELEVIAFGEKDCIVFGIGDAGTWFGVWNGNSQSRGDERK